MKRNVLSVVSVCAGVGLIAGVSGVAEGGPGFVMESFESGSAGNGVPAGWISRFPGGGTGLSDVVTSEGELSMRMEGLAFSANENYTAEKYWFGPGTTTISASIYVESFNQASDGCAGGFVAYFGPEWTAAFGVNQRDPGGPLTLGRTDVEAETGRWYHMVLVIEDGGARGRLFVDGNLVDADHQIDGTPPSGDVRLGSLVAHSGCTNLDPVVTYFDAIRIQGTQCVADLSGDGILDLEDISIFVNGFTAGCP